SCVVSASKAAFESSATIGMTESFRYGQSSKPRRQDFRPHAVALRADVGAQIGLLERGMSLDAEQPHVGAAPRGIWHARRFDRLCKGRSHVCKVTITWDMSTYTLTQPQTLHYWIDLLFSTCAIFPYLPFIGLRRSWLKLSKRVK